MLYCGYLYNLATDQLKDKFADLSPQDSTLLSDVVEIGSLPSFLREDEGTIYAFYLLTRQGLRIECSSISKIQVFLTVLAEYKMVLRLLLTTSLMASKCDFFYDSNYSNAAS